MFSKLKTYLVIAFANHQFFLAGGKCFDYTLEYDVLFDVNHCYKRGGDRGKVENRVKEAGFLTKII